MGGRNASGCRDKDKTPARYLSVLRSLDQATFNFATRLQTDKASERSAILDILRLLGRAEKVITQAVVSAQKTS